MWIQYRCFRERVSWDDALVAGNTLMQKRESNPAWETTNSTFCCRKSKAHERILMKTNRKSTTGKLAPGRRTRASVPTAVNQQRPCIIDAICAIAVALTHTFIGTRRERRKLLPLARARAMCIGITDAAYQ